jgi:hypothetical protein
MNTIGVTDSAAANGMFRHKVAAGRVKEVSSSGIAPSRASLRSAEQGGVGATLRSAQDPAPTYDGSGARERAQATQGALLNVLA